MSKVQTLRVVVKQRLTAAAEEIFELFERTIAEYEEELSRQRKLLDAVLKPQVQLRRTDVQKLLESKEEDPSEQQERSSSPDQEDPPELPHIKEDQEELPGLEEADIKFTSNPVPVRSEEDDDEEKPQSSQLHQRQTEQMETDADGEQEDPPDLPHIKEDQEELWIHQEGEQLPGLEEADINSTFTPVPVKIEDEEEEPQSSQLHQIKTQEIRDVERLKTEAEGEDCGGPEPVQDSDPDTHSQPADTDKTSHSFTFSHVTAKREEDDEEKPQTSQLQTEQMETEADGEDCRGPEPERTFNSVSHSQPVTDDGTSHCSGPETEDSGSECETDHSSDWETRTPQVRSEQQGSSCSVCKKTFPSKSDVVKHMRTHKREKTFSCSYCGEKFKQKSSLNKHVKLHAVGKQHTCSICKSSFSSRSNLNAHMRIHSEEKPFSCSVCGKKFSRNGTLKQHLTTHM